jgi:hypothetical protein
MKLFGLFNKNKDAEKDLSSYRSIDPEVASFLEGIIGTQEKPAKIENQKLADGTVYTGDAILCTDGFYLPNGFGKKVVSKDLELTGSWIDGNINGVCYMNMHQAMITGHFINSRPNGWCLSIEGGRGFVFGVFKKEDCVCSLGEAVAWMIRSMKFGLRINSNKKQIFVGEITNNQAKGFLFSNNGDVYVGTNNSHLDKTGYFFKFSENGYIQIGRFEQGVLVESLSPATVIKANGVSPNLLTTSIDTKKKYF